MLAATCCLVEQDQIRLEVLQGTYDGQAPPLRGAPAPQQLGHRACLYLCLHGYWALCLCLRNWGFVFMFCSARNFLGLTTLTWCAAVSWGRAGKHSDESVGGRVFVSQCSVVQRCAWTLLLASCTRHAGSCKGPQRCFCVCPNQAAATLVAHMQACMHASGCACSPLLHDDRCAFMV